MGGLLLGGVTLGPPRTRTGRRRRQRADQLRALVSGLARQDFERRHGPPAFAPVLVLLTAYLEADNIVAVLKAVPAEVDGLATTTLVVIDGGDDGTEEICDGLGVAWAKLPVNLGQGVALQLGYQLAVDGGARYVVTVDADGQNDPAEIPQLLAPLVAGDADFVVASRRLGVDRTSDSFRRTGVVVFAWLINRITGQPLTDTSNGFRALRAELLADVELEQDQYQTSELIISAARRGWRLAEAPTVWHPRASGESKKGHNVLFGLRYAAVILHTWRREAARR